MRSILLAFIVSYSLFAQPTPVKNFPLVNQEGKPFQLYDFKDKKDFIFVSFIFTRCPLPKMCPLTITKNKQLYKLVKNKKKIPLRFLLVTLDPDFDTAAVLKNFAKTRDLPAAAFTLATGNPQTLSDFAGEFNVMGIPTEGMISHNMKSILLSPSLVELQQYKDNEWKAEEVAQLIEKMISAK